MPAVGEGGVPPAAVVAVGRAVAGTVVVYCVTSGGEIESEVFAPVTAAPEVGLGA